MGRASPERIRVVLHQLDVKPAVGVAASTASFSARSVSSSMGRSLKSRTAWRRSIASTMFIHILLIQLALPIDAVHNEDDDGPR